MRRQIKQLRRWRQRIERNHIKPAIWSTLQVHVALNNKQTTHLEIDFFFSSPRKMHLKYKLHQSNSGLLQRYDSVVRKAPRDQVNVTQRAAKEARSPLAVECLFFLAVCTDSYAFPR